MKSRLVWLLLCGIWGSTWLFIKLGLEDLPPLTFAGIRFVIAAAIVFALIAVRRIPLPTKRRDWMLLAVTGVLSFTLNYGLVFWGEQYISSGLAALLQSTLPLFGLIIAHFYLPGERMTLAKNYWRVAGRVWRRRDLFQPVTDVWTARALGQCRARAQRFLRGVCERVGEDIRAEFATGRAGGRANAFWPRSVVVDWYSARRQSV